MSEKTSAILRIVLLSIVILLLAAILVVGILTSRSGFLWSWRGISFDEEGFQPAAHGTLPDSMRQPAGTQPPSSGPAATNPGTATTTPNASTPPSQPPAGGSDGNAVTVEAVNKIEIDWASGSIQIYVGSGDQIGFSETGSTADAYPMTYQVKNGELEIHFCRPGFNQTVQSKDLVLVLPAGWNGRELEINAALSDLTVTGVTCSEVSLSLAAGSADFQNCVLGELELDAAASSLAYTGQLTEFSMDSASGGANLVLTNVPRSIEMDTASGDLNLTLPAGASFDAKLETLSGDFTSDFSFTVSARGRYQAGTGGCRIEMDSMSGDLNIYQG